MSLFDSRGRRREKPVKYNTPAYEEWLERAYWETKWNEPPLDYRVNLCCHFYLEANRQVDLSALYEGIQDVLVKQGLLPDDNWKWIGGHDGSRVFVDPANPRMEILITKLDD